VDAAQAVDVTTPVSQNGEQIDLLGECVRSAARCGAEAWGEQISPDTSPDELRRFCQKHDVRLRRTGRR